MSTVHRNPVAPPSRRNCLIPRRLFGALTLALATAAPLRLPAQEPPPDPPWYALPRPGAPGYNHPSDFDWTGQVLAAYQHWFSGYSYTSFNTTYGGVQYPPLLMFGTGPGLDQVTIALAGTSEYHWEWRPPHDLSGTAGAPNYTLFPSQPMYALACVGPYIQAIPWTPPGLAATGQVSDGWGSTVSLAGIPGEAPGAAWPGGISRHVVAAAGDAEQTVPLSPSATVTGTAAPGGYSDGYVYLAGGQEPYLVTLQAPTPVARPDLGDGKNQFAYDSATPAGGLSVDANVVVPRALQADTSWLVSQDKVDLQIAPSIGGWVGGWAFAAVDGAIRPAYSSPPSSGAFRFIGLPGTNDGFGQHTMTLKVEGNSSQTATFETFFQGLSKNNPGLATRNWWYYYHPLYHPVTSTAEHYEDAEDAGCWTDFEYVIHIGTEGAFQEHMGGQVVRNHLPPVFALRDGKVTHVGRLIVWGILRYVYAYAHEKAHREHFVAGICSYSSPGPPADADGDTVLDTWESAHGLDPAKSDSTGAYQNTNEAATGDDECIADIDALGAVISERPMWQQDWAVGGLRWSNWGIVDPDFAGYFAAQTNPTWIHPWGYQPYDPDTHLYGSLTTTIPADALTSIG